MLNASMELYNILRLKLRFIKPYYFHSSSVLISSCSVPFPALRPQDISCFIPKWLKWQMTGGGVIVPGLFCCIHSRLSLHLLVLAAFQNPIKIVLGYPARRYIFIIRYFLKWKLPSNVLMSEEIAVAVFLPLALLIAIRQLCSIRPKPVN